MSGAGEIAGRLAKAALTTVAALLPARLATTYPAHPSGRALFSAVRAR